MLNTEENPKPTSVDALRTANTQRSSALVVGVVNTAMEGQLRNAIATLVAASPAEKFMPRLAVSKVYDAGVTGPNGAPVKYRAFIMSIWEDASIVARRSALGSIPNHEVLRAPAPTPSSYAAFDETVQREIAGINRLAGGFDEAFAETRKSTTATLKNLREAGRNAVIVSKPTEVEIRPGDLFIEFDAPEKCVTEQDLVIKEPGNINMARCASIADDAEDFDQAVSEFTEVLLAYDGNEDSLPRAE